MAYAILPIMEMPNNWQPFNWHKAHRASLTMGDRAADKMRNGMGSWIFVFAFLSFLGVWAILNSIAGIHHWDKYPFILLNLFLSMLAAIQGAILLIAAKRMDAISAVQAKNDYETNVQAKKEVEELMDINREQLKRIDELIKLLEGKK
jgi:uncharacterized membrane protein